LQLSPVRSEDRARADRRLEAGGPAAWKAALRTSRAVENVVSPEERRHPAGWSAGFQPAKSELRHRQWRPLPDSLELGVCLRGALLLRLQGLRKPVQRAGIVRIPRQVLTERGFGLRVAARLQESSA